MMAAYYRGLKTGLGRGESLRKAQLALQADPRRRHPYYWASFIQAGDWTPLKGY
jgi:CHAT domain-containing protein